VALFDGKKPRNLDPFPCRRIGSNQDVTSFLILTLVNPGTFFGSLVAGSHHRRNSFRFDDLAYERVGWNQIRHRAFKVALEYLRQRGTGVRFSDSECPSIFATLSATQLKETVAIEGPESIRLRAIMPWSQSNAGRVDDVGRDSHHIRPSNLRFERLRR
jgi:hypothetical protein